MAVSIKDQFLFSVDVVTESFKGMFKELEHHTPTTYDKIMDAVYRETHIGGGMHRMFDGNHTFSGSYEAIKSMTGQVDAFDFIKAHVNEVVTPEGIPLFNLDQVSFNHLSSEVSETLGGHVAPGQIRALARDMNSFNMGEVLSAGVGFAFMAYALNSGDPRATSRTVAVNLCLGIYTANPLQIFTGLAGLAAGVYKGKIQAWELLKGATPVLAGTAAYAIGENILDLSKGESLFVSIAISIGTAAYISCLDARNRKRVQEELGDSPFYPPVMTPHLLSKELEILQRRSSSLSVPV